MSIALFDLDGTLTNPSVGITRSLQFGLRRVGVEIAEPDSLASYIGPPLRESFARISGLSPADVEVALGAYREYYAATGIFENVLFPGIRDVLDQLVGSGWRLAVATSKPMIFAEQVLRHAMPSRWLPEQSSMTRGTRSLTSSSMPSNCSASTRRHPAS
jgi:phosphoglycolate phosphatase